MAAMAPRATSVVVVVVMTVMVVVAPVGTVVGVCPFLPEHGVWFLLTGLSRRWGFGAGNTPRAGG